MAQVNQPLQNQQNNKESNMNKIIQRLTKMDYLVSVNFIRMTVLL